MTVRVSLDARRMISTALLMVGIGCLGVYGSSTLYAKFHQLYESWSFDKARERGVNTENQTDEGNAPFAIFTPAGKSSHRAPLRNHGQQQPLSREGAVIGRVFVPRLSLTAMVEEGTDDDILLRAVGHIPGTALPGANGNVAIAGHRDSFLRALKDVRRNDEIDFETLDGSFRYTVDQLTVVDPDNISVLKPTPDKTLTIVTCFPFRYIGHAPRRYIVRARQVSELSKK
jgi:sortase A